MTSDFGVGESREFKAYIYETANNGVNQLSSGSQGIVSRVQAQNFNEIAELKIPLSDFKIDSVASQKITVKNTNLGSQELVVMGSSTSPYILALLGLISTVAFLFIKKKKSAFCLCEG